MAVDPERLEYRDELDDEGLVEFFWHRFTAAREWWEPIHEAGGKMYAMYAARSLGKKDEAYLKATDRIAIDVPFAKGIVDTIVGADQAQRPEPQFEPVDKAPTDAVLADWLTRVVRYLRLKSDGHRKETSAYKDMLVTGYGFGEAYLNVKRMPVRPFEGHIEVEQMFPDPDAREPNLTDARFFIRRVEWPLDEVQARWWEKRDEIKSGVAAGSIARAAPTRSQEGRWSRGAVPGGPAKSSDKVTVYEFQYKRPTPRVVYFDPEKRKMVDESHDMYSERKKELDARADAEMMVYEADLAAGLAQSAPPPAPARITDEQPYDGETWFRCFLLGNAATNKGMVLERKELTVNEPTIKCVTGYEDKDYDAGRTRFFGILHVIKDPQIYLNKALSTFLEIMARNAKGGQTVEKRALGKTTLDDYRKMQALPGGIKVVEDGAVAEGWIKDDPIVQTPGGFEKVIQLMIDLHSLLTGVSPALQGTLTSERSNVFISNLQEHGLQMLLPIREPRTAFTAAVGHLLAGLVVYHMPYEEIDKVLGDVHDEGLDLLYTMQPDPLGGPDAEVPNLSDEIDPETGEPLPVTAGMLLKDPRLLEYDVSTDVGAATASHKQDVGRFFQQHGFFDQVSKVSPEAAEALLPDIVRYSPLPGGVAEKRARDIEAILAQKRAAGTAEGVLAAFEQMLAQDQNGAMQLLQQLSAMIQPPAAPAPAAETVQ